MDIEKSLLGIAIASAVALSFFIGRETAKNAPICPPITKTDTLYLKDTIFREKPIYVASTIIDTMFLVVKDTIRQNDTTYIPIPMEKKTYKDKDYMAIVSGYQPSLDHIEIYKESKVITNTILMNKPNSVYLSVGAMYNKQFSTPITLNYEHLWKWFAIGGGGGYDPMLRSPIIQINGKVLFSW